MAAGEDTWRKSVRGEELLKFLPKAKTIEHLQKENVA